MSSPQQRLSSVANQLAAPGSARQKLLAKNPDDIVCYQPQNKYKSTN
jgi:hypothetical protein